MPQVLLAIGAIALIAKIIDSASTPPAPRPPRQPQVLRWMPGYEAEARVAINAFNRVVQIYAMASPPDLEFIPGADAHYDPNTHTVRMDLRWVRRMLRFLCDDTRCSIHVITAFTTHEMRHAMQVHRADDSLAILRRHEDDADFAIGIVLAYLGLDPAEVHHVMEHLGGPGHTEHSPGHRRAELVWRGYYSVRAA